MPPRGAQAVISVLTDQAAEVTQAHGPGEPHWADWQPAAAADLSADGADPVGRASATATAGAGDATSTRGSGGASDSSGGTSARGSPIRGR